MDFLREKNKYPKNSLASVPGGYYLSRHLLEFYNSPLF